MPVASLKTIKQFQTVRDCTGNARTIKNMREKHNYGRVKKIIGEDQVLLDAKFYVTEKSFRLLKTETLLPQNRFFGMLVRELEVFYLCQAFPLTK
jgi:hypothetical protein